ncbi:MAG: hypothetical protein HWN65_20015, partial [Candidatus Helarchaeota archaeon]|nr:hypothetical protein [Candidatus Helarchaeota archaeon]
MIKFKIILLGDEGVGKTSLIKKYGGFVGPEYGKVIGVDFGHKRIEINNMLVWLQFCKVNQDPRFKYLRPLYYREAMA